jgi:hypothetical protein
MPAPDGAPLIADGQVPTTAQTPPFEDGATIFALHTVQKAMLPAARDAFGLPCTLWHSTLSLLLAL